MTLNRIGDLAEHFLLRRQNVALKSQLQTLTQEISSGRRADVANPLTGDYTYLSDIERSLSMLSGFDNSVREAALFTDASQAALDLIQSVSTDLGRNTLSVAGSQVTSGLDLAAQRAAEDFGVMVGALNTTQAGRSLFAGVATSGAALAPPTDILTSLRADVAGAATPEDLVAAVDAWFMQPAGGFETSAYQGSTTSLSAAHVARGTWVSLNVRADDLGLRSTLRDTALVALSTDPSFGFDTSQQVAVMTRAAEGLLADQSALTSVRAGLGHAQEQIEHARVRNQAERSSVEMAQSELVSIDPYEAATRLENVQDQLESLYAVTARMSRMSLLDFLR